MKMKHYGKIMVLLALLPFVLVSCNKREGEGGTGTVQGYVKLVHHPDDDYQLGVDTLNAAKTDVFIVYGDEEFYGDDTETNPDGLYQFEYLTPGNYTVFAYSTLATGEKVAVSETIKLERGQTAQVPTIYVHDGKSYGTSVIVGKVWGLYFHNLNDFRGEGWAYEHRVYLRKLGEVFHQDDVRVGVLISLDVRQRIFAAQRSGRHNIAFYSQF